MNGLVIGSFGFIGTVFVYLLAQKFHRKYSRPYTSPMIIGSIVIIVFLVVFNIPYEAYMVGGGFISKFLGPAVVALAYPLYMQRETLKKFAMPIIGGSLVGSMIGVGSGILLAKMLKIDREVLLSIVPKSVTTPVAMEIATSIGGIAPLAAIFVITAGIGGILVSSIVMKVVRVKDPIAYGVGMGSASHAIGTAAAMEQGELEGSVSTIAMVVCAVFVSMITPLFVALLI